MDLRELKYFLSVARQRSFTRAAEELFIAQPALSRQVRKLEDELGLQLFTRHAKGVDLTEAGRSLLARAEPLMHLLRQIKAEVSAASEEPEGHLSIAVPPAAGLLLAEPFYRVFSRRHPRVSLHLREGVSAMLQEWLLNRHVDLAVMHNPPPLPGLHILPLLEEPTVLIGKAGLPAPRELTAKGLPVACLQALPLILPAAPHNNRLIAERAARQSGVSLNVVLEVDSVSITKSLVAQGHGYAIFTETAVHREVAEGLLCTYPLQWPMEPSVLALAWRRGENTPYGLTQAVSAMQDILRETVTDRRWPGQVRLLA